MKRRLVKLLTVASLALLLGVAALWVTGHVRSMNVGVGVQGRTQLFFGTQSGRLSLGRVRWDDPALGGRPGPIWQSGRSGFYSAGSYWCDPNGPKYGSTRWVMVPCWAAAAPLTIVPAWRAGQLVRRRRARRMRAKGLCARCGYDLRATPGRCPECGEPADPTPPRVLNPQ